jgi:hypothetical protein
MSKRGVSIYMGINYLLFMDIVTLPDFDGFFFFNEFLLNVKNGNSYIITLCMFIKEIFLMNALKKTSKVYVFLFIRRNKRSNDVQKGCIYIYGYKLFIVHLFLMFFLMHSSRKSL